MYFYFFCEFPAVVKFQGVIFGRVDNSVKFCNLSAPYPLTEICPLSGGENLNFYPDADFLDNPPENLTVTDLKGGYFLRFNKPRNFSEFKIVEQAKFSGATITAFIENGFKLSLETHSGFYAETLAFSPVSARFIRGEGANADLIFALFDCGDKKILHAYSLQSPALLLSINADEFNPAITGFTVTERLRDMAKHVVTHDYRFDGKKIRETGRKVSACDKFDRENLPEKLIPYAFTEEFSCGGDYSFYLADSIKENADKLQSYFGTFLGVTPPPVFRKYDEVGLIYKHAERKYSVEYFSFEIKDKKISNIKKS
ncbi:MAG: hypothetical protein J5911_04315 [Clostridia bacterium]|nr:hypothetical protein [Clostridia bacterium]